MDSAMPYFLVWPLYIIKRLVHHVVYCISLSCLLSFLCNPYIPFLIYEIFHLLVSFHFLLLLGVTVIECNNNLLCLKAVMHALTIPYDMIHSYMYAQEVVRAKGLKEWQTLLYLLLLLTIIIIHILTGI